MSHNGQQHAQQSNETFLEKAVFGTRYLKCHILDIPITVLYNGIVSTYQSFSTYLRRYRNSFSSLHRSEEEEVQTGWR